MARRRHPKKDVEQAVRAAEAAGWSVTEIHRGHRWGLLTCPAGLDTVTLFSTPEIRLPWVSASANKSTSARTKPAARR